MHFTSIATGLFCVVSLVAAQPPRTSSANGCCCCDISRSLISCDLSISKAECICAAVACPANAATVYTNGQPPPTAAVKMPKPSPVLESNDVPNTADSCCCCDGSKNVISCSRSRSKSECFCAAVACPKDAPIVWANDELISMKDAADGPVAGKSASVATTKSPRAVPSTEPGLNDGPRRFVTVAKPAQPKPMPLGCVMPSSLTGPQFNCCCCNAGINKMVCQLREQQDCVCAAVACPHNAETIHVEPPVCTSI
ncbi:hypothetical protein NOR_06537 [Metarhizium rileyi]|uniref:Uncharacterized protein n=1 Tax=Metarhizium rileyi (strain RCEF 4871) TaxID=1649241 RepID=A0A167AGA5_METRR|nr:hypothetical protein NOR_06537 [Metarhizium rileyi RCEF 4871]